MRLTPSMSIVNRWSPGPGRSGGATGRRARRMGVPAAPAESGHEKRCYQDKTYQPSSHGSTVGHRRRPGQRFRPSPKAWHARRVLRMVLGAARPRARARGRRPAPRVHRDAREPGPARSGGRRRAAGPRGTRGRRIRTAATPVPPGRLAIPQTAAEALSAKVIAGDQEATQLYFRFLGTGGSKYPVELLKDAGVDMTTDEPLSLTMAKMNRVMDEIEGLLGNSTVKGSGAN